MPYLSQVGSTYHLRYRLPSIHSKKLGRKVLKMSLKTGNKRLANRRAQNLVSALRSYLDQISPEMISIVTQEELNQGLREFLEILLYEDELRRANPPHFVTNEHAVPPPPKGVTIETFKAMAAMSKNVDNGIPLREQLGDLENQVFELERGLHWADYSYFSDYIDRFMESAGLDIERGTQEFNSIARAVYKTLQDLFNIKILRNNTDIKGEREYLLGLQKMEAVNSHLPNVMQGEAIQSLSLEDAVEKYIRIKSNGEWSNATIRAVPTQLRRVVDILGSKLPIASLNRDHMRKLKSHLESLPISRYRDTLYLDKTDEELLDMEIPEKHLLKAKTLDTNFTAIRSFLNWCEEEEILANTKPLKAVLKVSKQKAKKHYPKRRAFTHEELQALFENDDYRKWKFTCAAKFWAPIIALFTGARLEEICQLHLDDFKSVDGIPYIDINSSEGKNLKTEASNRVVPIHPFLIEIGLLKRVEYLKGLGEKHLFHRDTLSQSGDKISANISKAFTYFRRKHGVGGGSEETSEVCFHSFRHTVVTWAKFHHIDRSLVKEIVGHEDNEFDDITSIYEDENPVKTKYEQFISKLDFDMTLDLKSLKNSKWVTGR